MFSNTKKNRKKEKKKLLTYYKTYRITTLKKNVDVDDVVIVKKIEEEVNGLIRETLER
jgi:hypothetical protein